MNTTQEFLNKISRLTVDSHKDQTFTFEGGWTITYNFKLEEGAYTPLPVQIVINVRRDGANIQTWGAGDNECQELMARWINTYKNMCRDIVYNEKESLREENITAFEAL